MNKKLSRDKHRNAQIASRCTNSFTGMLDLDFILRPLRGLISYRILNMGKNYPNYTTNVHCLVNMLNKVNKASILAKQMAENSVKLGSVHISGCKWSSDEVEAGRDGKLSPRVEIKQVYRVREVDIHEGIAKGYIKLKEQ